MTRHRPSREQWSPLTSEMERSRVMGESRKRKRGHAAILAANPFCIYCGGTERATTIDHMPPRIMFRGKHRPGQFEFPSCDHCNQRTKATDQFAAYIGRLYPDATTATDQDEVRKILNGLKNNLPGVLQEMYIGRAGQKLASKRVRPPNSGGVLRLDGPLASKHLDIFGCKLGLAMHFEATGNALPRNGGIAIRVFSNVEALEEKIPDTLAKLLPGPQTLRQGTRDVADQFQYSVRLTDDKTMGLFFASFRFSFAVVAATSIDRSSLSAMWPRVFSPGEPWKVTK